jgi:amidase
MPEYLFSVNTRTPPTMTVDSGEEFTVEVRGAFDNIEDISAVPTPFTPACDGHPLAPIAGPIVVRGAKPGDVVAIDLIELTPFGSGKSAILRDFGVLRREFPEPMAVSSDVRDGRAWFGGRIPLPLNPNLGTISTMPPEGYKPSYAGAYGGDFDQKDAGQGSRVYLPVLVEDALVFFGDPHAAISDGIITGTGIECSKNVRARITLMKDKIPRAADHRSGRCSSFCRGRSECRRSNRRRRSPGCRLCGRTNRCCATNRMRTARQSG